MPTWQLIATVLTWTYLAVGVALGVLPTLSGFLLCGYLFGLAWWQTRRKRASRTQRPDSR